MNARAKLILVFCLLLPAGAESEQPNVRDLDKKIKTHRKDLEQIEQQIKSLENERERLRKDEDSLGKTVKNLESDIERSTKKQVLQKKTILETEAQMKRLKQQMTLLNDEGLMWEQAAFNDLRSYHQRVSFPRRLSRNPMEAWVLRAAVRLRLEQMRDTAAKVTLTQDKEKDLERYKTKLVRMRSEMEIEIARQKKIREEKGRLYKTTQGKRLIAEQEAQRLNETREELEKLITNLAESRKKTVTDQRESQALKKSFQERRGNFPWPAEGTVVSVYGRQKHPDLNITVINNGIRIKTAPGANIKAVEKGTVIYASDFRSYGRTVIVDHGGDTFSVYGLLGDIAVKEGEKVLQGKALGTASDENNSQIYFELKNQGRSENPILWLNKR